MALPFLIGVVALLGILLLLWKEIRRAPIESAWRKRVGIALATTLLILTGLAFYAFLIEPNRLVIHRQAIQITNCPAALSGLRIAVISDIHVGGPFIDDDKLRLIVDRTNELKPDLIVILGDYMSGNSWHGHRVEPVVFAPHLKGLQAPLGVYSVLGNHDWWYNGLKVRYALEANGIKVLEDEVSEVKRGSSSFWLAGLADRWTRPQHIRETIDRVPAGAPVIALTHNPDIFPNLPKRVPLLLAGHTHGGQVNFPLIGRPIEPSDFGQKYAAGHVFENDHHLFVTTGIGTSILPVRFRVTPEIVLLTLQGQ